MKVELTEFECLQEAGKLYKGFLTLDKAISFLKFENNWDVEIIEDDLKNINASFCLENNIDPKHMIFMKKLQESGEVNMFMSHNIVMTRLLLDKKEASEVIKNYMRFYKYIYNPQSLI